jgi:GNAT superfamily N-acetyltransferase
MIVSVDTVIRSATVVDDAGLAFAEARPVGMAWLAIVDRIPGPAKWLRRAGSLQSVYVRPEERGQGIGTRLVGAAIGAARDRGLEYVSVHPSTRSFALYRRAGFVSAGGALELRLVEV